MSSRLYLRETPASQPGAPIGTATTDTDAGHVGSQRLVCMTMSKTKGAAQVERAWNYGIAGPAHCDLVALYISPALAGQTLAAGERFTHGGGWRSGLIKGGSFIYLWRPGVGWIATLFGDDPNRRTNDWGPTWEWPEQESWFVGACDSLGQDIEVRLRDRIVLEAWLNFAWEDADERNKYGLYWNGTDDSKSHGDLISDAAAYLEYSGDLILAQEASMNSANILVGARDLQVDGANVGALDGGASVTYEPTHIEHTVDQRMGVQRVDKVAERMTVTANLKEATLENLRIAWGQPASALSTAGDKTTLHVGGDDAVTEHVLVLTGKAPGTTRTRTITCHKAVAIETSAHSYTKEGATVYPVTFVLVEDASKGAGFKYMTIEDDEGQFQFA